MAVCSAQLLSMAK